MKVLIDSTSWSLAFLICAVAVRNGFSIFTTDGDFAHFAKILPITLYDS